MGANNLMDNYNVTSKEGYFDGDIEKGEVNIIARMSELQGENTNNVGLGDGVLSNKPEERVVSSVSPPGGNDDLKAVRLIVVDRKVLEEKNNGDIERKVVKEKPKGMSAKKPPKPPRPPRGLSLDSADQKLIRELHELARFKRARVERIKALKKAKETKAASSKNQLFATFLTILFCLVLLLQGMSSRTSTIIRGPPFSSEVAEQLNVISIRHLPLSATVNGPGSESPRLVEQVSGADTTKQMSRAVG